MNGRWFGVILFVLSGGRGGMVLLPGLCARRGSVVGGRQRSPGMVSHAGLSRDLDLFLWMLVVRPGAARRTGWYSPSLSVVAREVHPRSGRRLGRSREKKLVRDLERVLRLAVLGDAEALSR